MAKKFYPPKLIDDLMEQIPYEEVLQFYGLPVRGSGKNRGSECPKCKRNHHHFKVNTFRNTAHCFSCKWAGNPIQYIQEVDGIGFLEAVEKYAAIGNFPLPDTDKPKYTVKDRILYHTVQFYKKFDSDYLQGRGIADRVIKDYDIGYAPGGTKLKEYLNALSFSDEQLLDAGVIVERKGELRDYFYYCVVIPIVKNGLIVDLYGRHVKDGNVKHMYLYGNHISFHLDKINPKLPIIIVESIINALTLISHGITNVMATGGALFDKRHARQIKAKGVTKAYVGYDTGDINGAGKKAAIIAGKLLEDHSIEASIIQMPRDTDINELFIRFEFALEKMRRMILEAKPVLEFELEFLLDQMPIEWVEKYLLTRRDSRSIVHDEVTTEVI